MSSIHQAAFVHPTAVVDPNAGIDEHASIGPYCVVGPRVSIGAGTRLHSHVVVDGETCLGRGCQVFPFACLGGVPQDRKYRGERSALRVGEGNIIREYVTMNGGTAAGEGITIVGHSGIFMAHSHVAHDCRVGDHVVLANSVALAGHVDVGDHAVFGGLSGVHQFVRVGTRALIAAGAMVSQDVPPFTCVQGDRARLCGLNTLGLRRAGMTEETIRTLGRAYRMLFRSALPLRDALEAVQSALAASAELELLMDFVRESKRGVCRDIGGKMPVRD